MATRELLRLPSKKVTGVDTSPPIFGPYPFINASQTWKGLIPRNADRKKVPVAWTTYLESLAAGTSEAVYIASGVVVSPNAAFAGTKTLLRRPKIVLSDFRNNVSEKDIVSPLLADLKRKNILVAETADSFAGTNVQFFRSCFLPHNANQEIADTRADLSTNNGIYPVVAPSEWLGGEVLYLSESTLVAGGANVGSITDPAGPPIENIFAPFTNGNNTGIQLVKDAFPRYARFGAHWTFPTDWHPSETSYGNIGAIRAEVSRIMAALVGYNCTLKYVNGHYLNTKAQVETSFRNKIIEFFGL